MNLPRKSAASSRFWKWRSRSSKSNSETDPRDALLASSSNSPPLPTHLANSYPVQQVMSPYLSEEAHVLSLQNPSANPSPGALVRPALGHIATSPSSDEIQGAGSEQDSPEELLEKSKNLTPGCLTASRSAKSLYLRAKREIESRFKGTGHQQVRLMRVDNPSKRL